MTRQNLFLWLAVIFSIFQIMIWSHNFLCLQAPNISTISNEIWPSQWVSLLDCSHSDSLHLLVYFSLSVSFHFESVLPLNRYNRASIADLLIVAKLFFKINRVILASFSYTFGLFQTKINTIFTTIRLRVYSHKH